jgi:hypothetical protein
MRVILKKLSKNCYDPGFQELWGDSCKEAIEIQDHISLDEIKEAYLKCVPHLGVKP